MSDRPKILCMGEPLVEFVRLEGTDPPAYQRGVGGDTSNAAIAAARQGASVGYLTALGADAFGDAIVALWEAEGVDHAHVARVADAPTGIYFIDPDPSGRFFTYYRAGSAASLYAPGNVGAALAGADILHLSGITLAVSETLRTTALDAAAQMAGAGKTVSLDTNLRLKLWTAQTARAVLDAAMSHARIAVTSIDDSADLTGLSDPAAIAAYYRALGPEIVLVTMGAEGCHVTAGERSAMVPAVPTVAVDSTGAGDSFAGGFLAWWAETGDPFEAAARAAIVSSGTVSGYGATAPIPHRAAVLDRRAHG